MALAAVGATNPDLRKPGPGEKHVQPVSEGSCRCGAQPDRAKRVQAGEAVYCSAESVSGL